MKTKRAVLAGVILLAVIAAVLIAVLLSRPGEPGGPGGYDAGLSFVGEPVARSQRPRRDDAAGRRATSGGPGGSRGGAREGLTVMEGGSGRSGRGSSGRGAPGRGTSGREPRIWKRRRPNWTSCRSRKLPTLSRPLER